MQQHYLSRLFNLILPILALILMAISFMELMKVNQNTLTSQELVPIGLVTELKNSAKVKKENLFAWNGLEEKQTLHANDLVFTNKESELEFKIGKHNKITLSPESLIQLHDAESIKVGQGTIKIAFNEQSRPIQITLGQKKLILSSKNAQITISQSATDMAKIEVQNGELNIQEQITNQNLNLVSEQTVTFDQTKTKITENQLSLISPNNEKIILDKMTSIPFKIRNILNKSVTILISTDPSFKQNVVKQQNVNIDFQQLLLPGKYFWKIESEKEFAEVSSFEIFLKAAPLTMQTPENQFEEKRYSENTTINFQWECSNPNQKNRLILSRLNGEIVLEKTLTQTRYSWNTNLTGDFTWFIQSDDPYVISEASLPHHFSLIKETYQKNKPIVIELNRPNQLVEFKWENDSKNLNLFQVSDDENFQNVVIEKKLMRNQTSITFPKTGKYYWRSMVIDSNGKRKENKPVLIIIKPTPAPLQPQKLPDLKLEVYKQYKKSIWDWLIPSAYADESNKAPLKWKAISDAKLYEIEIFSDKNLKHKIDSFTSKSSFYQWSFPRTGEYYWRYRFQDFWGRYSPFSEASLLVIKAKSVPSNKIEAKQLPASNFVSEFQNNKTEKLYRLGVMYAPTFVNFTQTKYHSYEIDGLATSGLILDYRQKINSKNYLSARFKNITGKVFDEEDFYHQQALLTFHHPWKLIYTHAGFRFIRQSRYLTQNSSTVFDSIDQAMLLNLGAKYLWQRFDLLSEINISYGQFIYYDLQLSKQIYKKNNLLWKIHMAYEFFDNNSSNNNIKSQQFQIAIGPQYLF